MDKKQLNYKNIAVLTRPIKGQNVTIGTKVDNALKSRKPFKVTLKDRTYDLVPLMALFIGGNVYNNSYFDNNYIETICLRVVHDYIKREKYTGSVIQQKEGLINQSSEAWSKCVNSICTEMLDARIEDYATVLNVVLYNNPWGYDEIWRYYTTYLALSYFRFIEEKKTPEMDVLYSLVDICILSDTTSYFEEYRKGEIDYNTTRGIEFVLINLLKYFLLEDLVDETTQEFLDTFTNDIPLCKFLKMFEVGEDAEIPVGMTIKPISRTNTESYSDVINRVYCKSFDYGNDTIRKTSDEMYTYTSFIMRVVDDLFQSRVNNVFAFLEREGVAKSRYAIESEKNVEIKKLSSTIKKLQKSVESYKFTDTKSKELIKELRIKASNSGTNDIIHSKDKEIEKLTRLLADRDLENTRLKSKLSSTQKRVETLESKEIKMSDDAENTIRDLEEDLENLERLCDYYESTLNSSVHKTFEDYKNEIKDMKICVIGGPNGFEKRLDGLSKNITHINIKDCNYSYEVPQCDLIIINSSINSHSHENTARRVAKTKGIPFVRTQITNIELLAKLVYQYKLTM